MNEVNISPQLVGCIDYYSMKGVAEYFDADPVNIFDNSHTMLMELLSNVYNRSAYNNFGTLVDLGCGTGNMLLRVLEKFPFQNIYGLDLSQQMLDIAKGKIYNLHSICDSAYNVQKYFNNNIDLMVISFIFAYVDYKKIIRDSNKLLRDGGIYSIIYCTEESFQLLKKIAVKKDAPIFDVTLKVICFLFNLNLKKIDDDFASRIPQDTNAIVQEIEQNNGKVLETKEVRIKISLKNWQEVWKFIHDSGWFIGALKQYKINKFKAFIIFSLLKIFRVLKSTAGKFEDEMVVAIIIAKKSIS